MRPDFEGLVRDAAKRRLDEEKERLRQRLLDELTGGEPGADEDAEPEPETPEDALKKGLRDLLNRDRR